MLACRGAVRAHAQALVVRGGPARSLYSRPSRMPVLKTPRPKQPQPASFSINAFGFSAKFSSTLTLRSTRLLASTNNSLALNLMLRTTPEAFGKTSANSSSGTVRHFARNRAGPGTGGDYGNEKEEFRNRKHHFQAAAHEAVRSNFGISEIIFCSRSRRCCSNSQMHPSRSAAR